MLDAAHRQEDSRKRLLLQPAAASSRNHRTRPSGRIKPAGYWLGAEGSSLSSARKISRLSWPQTKKNVFRAWFSTTGVSVSRSGGVAGAWTAATHDICSLSAG